MNGRPLLTMLDWELLQRLRAHVVAASGSVAELAARLGAETLPVTAAERRELAFLDGGSIDLGPRHMLPLRLRGGAGEVVDDVAALLVDADADPEGGSLTGLLAALAAVDDAQELFAAYWLLLAYASEEYRFCALGLEGDFDRDVSYDGEPVLLRAVGGLVPPAGRVDALHPPAAVGEIAAGLARLDLDALPDGDVGPLQAHFEDAALGSDIPETLEDVGRTGIERLLAYYREAAAAGRAVRVHG